MKYTVVDAPPSLRNTGTVTFIARFLDHNIQKEIAEKSLFEKIDGEWFYVASL